MEWKAFIYWGDNDWTYIVKSGYHYSKKIRGCPLSYRSERVKILTRSQIMSLVRINNMVFLWSYRKVLKLLHLAHVIGRYYNCLP